MTERLITRGDTYVNIQPAFEFEIVDDALAPWDLTGCTIRSTWKTAPTDPATDPTDAGAPIRADVVFDGSGTPTTSDRLRLPPGATAAEGRLQLVLTDTETAALPTADTVLFGDVQVTTAAGEHVTVFIVETVRTRDGYTNRTT